MSSGKSGHTGFVMATYLMGILIGGLYLGVVSPARTVIQADFGIDSTLGIWMINIYSLFYASLIPIIGKLADKRGRKRVFIACMGVFCAGSILCGFSQHLGGFGALLAGRVMQAIGAGGVIPVANSQIATTFPSEKRGTALGIAAAVMGVANVLGAAAGSAVVGVFGTQNWPVMFYLCVPFCVAVMAMATAIVPDTRPEASGGKADVAGSALFMLFVLLLLLGIKGIDWLDLTGSFLCPAVLGALAGAVVVALAFRLVERRAEDPVFHLEYFHITPIVITMVVSFFIGCFVISLVLVPELAEFATGAPLGLGGYYILAIGAASIVVTPLGGRLIDRIGPKPVLIIGFAVSILGLLYLALVAAIAPTPFTLVLGLFIVGAGMGFAMGAPTNYMILENTDPRDSTSAIATIPLVRQIGTTVAPAILTGMIATAPGMAGYQHMLLCVAVFNTCALLAILPYRQKSRHGKPQP